MRRIKLVLAVVAAMVAVLVFAAPAFAVPPPDPGIHKTEPVHCPGVGDYVAPIATLSQEAPGKSILENGVNPGKFIHEGQTTCTETEAPLGTVYKPGLGHDDPQAPGGL